MNSGRRERIDTHAHVFHPGLRFIESRRFTPSYDASLALYLQELDRNHVTSGVVVALSVLGTDNSYLLESLRHANGRLRGVVGIDPATDLHKFDDFEAAGVVGVRVNLTGGLPVPRFGQGAWAEAVAECVRRCWHVEINDRCGRLNESLEPLLDAGVRVVVDHFGMPDPTLGTNDPGFKRLLAHAPTRRVWVKLSGAYRFSPAVADLAAPQLRDAFKCDRLLWASDWPFTQHESTQTYGAQLAKLDRWVPDATERQTVLRDTPRELFKFGAESSTQP
jgi:predicted TIM-barrel fold metal-dependent hydrolase